MTHASLGRSALLLCVLVGPPACAYGPDIGTMQVDPVCHVWTTNGMGRMSARVPGAAELYAAMGKLEGRWVDDQNFTIGGFIPVKGTFDGARMTVGRGLGKIKADIRPPAARINGIFGDLTFAGNAACDARGLALGTAVIAVAIASSQNQ